MHTCVVCVWRVGVACGCVCVCTVCACVHMCVVCVHVCAYVCVVCVGACVHVVCVGCMHVCAYVHVCVGGVCTCMCEYRCADLSTQTRRRGLRVHSALFDPHAASMVTALAVSEQPSALVTHALEPLARGGPVLSVLPPTGLSVPFSRLLPSLATCGDSRPLDEGVSQSPPGPNGLTENYSFPGSRKRGPLGHLGFAM